jgi:hypothetical protein
VYVKEFMFFLSEVAMHHGKRLQQTLVTESFVNPQHLVHKDKEVEG